MMRVLGILYTIVVMLGVSCKEDQNQLSGNSYYTCPMHPSVRSEGPGSCPICGMDLVQKALADSSQHAGMVHLTLRQEKRAGIKTDSLKTVTFKTSLEIPGRVVADPGNRKLLTARVPGIVSKLYVKTPQATVRRGQPIFEIFSESLNSDIREYVVIRKRTQGKSMSGMSDELLAAARQKLVLWGLSDSQIEEAYATGRDITSVFYSDWDGILTNIAVTEGAYVETGDEVIEVTSLTRVWVELSGYAGEQISGTAQVKNRNGSKVPGEIILQSPITGSGQRAVAYVSIDNTSGDFYPGQEVSVVLTGANQNAFMVPRNAVVPGSMEVVWLKTGRGMYEPRMVKTGQGQGDSVEIIYGLDEGDRIVTEGVYLLNSEYILQRGAGAAHQH